MSPASFPVLRRKWYSHQQSWHIMSGDWDASTKQDNTPIATLYTKVTVRVEPRLS